MISIICGHFWAPMAFASTWTKTNPIENVPNKYKYECHQPNHLINGCWNHGLWEGHIHEGQTPVYHFHVFQNFVSDDNNTCNILHALLSFNDMLLKLSSPMWLPSCINRALFNSISIATKIIHLQHDDARISPSIPNYIHHKSEKQFR